MKVFEWFAKTVKRHPWLVVIACAALTLFLGVGVLFLNGEASYWSILPRDFPSVKTLDRLESELGGISYSKVLITAPSVTDPRIVQFLMGLEDYLRDDPRFNEGQVQMVPGEEGPDVPRILSQPVPVVLSYLSPFAANVKAGIAESGFSISLSKLSDAVISAQTGKGLRETVEQDYLGNPQARAAVVGRHRFITPDYKATLVMIKTGVGLSEKEQAELAAGLEELFESKLGGIEGVELLFAGDPTLVRDFERHIRSKTIMLFLIALAFVALILFLAFRRFTDTVLPILFLVLGLVWTFGLMGWVGIPYSVATIAVMPLLLGTALTFVVPFVARYYEEMEQRFRSVDAIGKAVTTIGVGLLLTAITNAFGFLVFQFSILPPLKEFGLTCAFGTLFIFTLSVTLLPAVMVLRDRYYERPGKTTEKKGAHFDGLSRRRRQGLFAKGTDVALDAFSALATRHTALTIVVFTILTLAGILSIRSLTTDSDLRKLVPRELPGIKADFEIEKYFGGSQQDVLLVTGDVLAPESLEAMLLFEDAVAGSPNNSFEGEELYSRSGMTSLADALAEASNGVVPGSEAAAEGAIEVAAQNGAFIEGSLVSPDRGTALITLDAAGAESATAVDAKMELMRLNADRYLVPAGLSYELGGMTPLTKDMTRNIIPTEMLSALLSLLLCAIVLSVIFRSIPYGVITLTVVAAGVAAEIGFLALMNWPLDVVTSLSSALVIGVGVNFGILFTHRYLQEMEKPDRLPAEAINITMLNLGRANIVAALATVAAFLFLMFSGIVPLKRFGGVTAFAIGWCLITSLTLMPALLMRLSAHRQVEQECADLSPAGP